MIMKKKLIMAAFVLTALICSVVSPAALYAESPFIPNVPIMPLKNLKPGMVGEVHTVISGTTITKFKVTIVGVVPRKTSPKNLILFKIEDKKINEDGGVAAGMSGSPIYVSGKLIGAIGYSWSFSERSLGLATPIEDMVAALNWPDNIPSFSVSKKINPQPMNLDKILRVTSADALSSDSAVDGVASDDEKTPISDDFVVTPSSSDRIPDGAVTSKDLPVKGKDKESSSDKTALQDRAKDGYVITISEENGKNLKKELQTLFDADLKPLAMPLLVDGMSPRGAEMLRKKLGVPVISLGLSAPSSGNADLNVSLKPGAAIGVALSWGDVQTGGIGTLSAVDSHGRFLAFAHPMMNQGAVAFPLTEAGIIKIIPSMEHSFKLGYMGKIIGLVTQDRPEAIGGQIGKLAPAFSYTVRFHDVDTNKKVTKRFQTVADSFTGPAIASAGILGIIDDQWARGGEGTAIINYKFSGGNLNKGWQRRNIFFSDKDLLKSLMTEFDNLSKIFSLNQFQEIRPFGVDIDVEITRDPRVVFIEKVEIADKKDFYSPGDQVKVDVTMRPWRKQSRIKRMTLIVPQKAVGFCEIVVRGGGIDEPNPESLVSGLRAITNLDDLMKELSAKESNNQILLQINGPKNNELTKNKKISQLSPEDFLDDRLQSEIRNEQVKEGALKIIDTNYYVEGILRKYIKVKNEAAFDEGSLTMPETESSKQERSNSESDSDTDERGEQPEFVFSERVM